MLGVKIQITHHFIQNCSRSTENYYFKHKNRRLCPWTPAGGLRSQTPSYARASPLAMCVLLKKSLEEALLHRVDWRTTTLYLYLRTLAEYAVVNLSKMRRAKTRRAHGRTASRFATREGPETRDGGLGTWWVSKRAVACLRPALTVSLKRASLVIMIRCAQLQWSNKNIGWEYVYTCAL